MKRRTLFQALLGLPLLRSLPLLQAAKPPAPVFFGGFIAGSADNGIRVNPGAPDCIEVWKDGQASRMALSIDLTGKEYCYIPVREKGRMGVLVIYSDGRKPVLKLS